MKRRGIIRLLWTALGIHVLYFILSGMIAANQQVILERLSYSKNPHLFSLPGLMLGAFVFLMAHGVLTVMLAGRRSSVTCQWTGVVLFGAGLPLLDLIGGRMVSMLAGRLGGMDALVSVTLLHSMFGLIAPIRMIAVSLFLLAVGMSIYEKQSAGNGYFSKPKGLGKLLWWSLGLDGAFFLIMAFITVYQNQFKTLLEFPESELLFVCPVTLIAGYGTLLAVHLLLTLPLVRQLKTAERDIVCEILGILLFSGWLGWVDQYLNRLSSNLMARQGPAALGNYSAVTEIIRTFSPLHTIGISLFIIGCGMLIYRKNGGLPPGGGFCASQGGTAEP